MSFFKRLFRIASAEAHGVADKLEDPIRMIEQGLRDLRKDLQESMKALAEVKALQIRTRRDLAEKTTAASDYERKAMLLLKKGEAGALDPAQVDRLASEALAKKETLTQDAANLTATLSQHEGMCGKLDGNVAQLKAKINSWENELASLRARSKVAAATQKVNRQLAEVDSSGTVSMLEKMKDRVVTEEALAESYGEMAAIPTSVDAEIDKALGGGSAGALPASDSLAALKAKMGLKPLELGS